MQTMAQSGLVYTNDNCIGCHRCISVCPVITANHAVEFEDGTCRIEVDGSKCIACGACFDACEHHARDFRDDTEQFFADLANGEKISVLWAPAFAANYPDEYERLLGGLKKMGVNHIVSIGFGADITTWGYLKYITEHDFRGGISQPCPAIVNYIEHFAPELIPKLVPIHSPLMCGAVYVRKYMGIGDKLAFISPCIAKKREINDPNTGGLVTYNVAFEHLMRYARAHEIFADPMPNEIEYGLGSIYPMPGGLRENVQWFCGDDLFIRQIEGEKRAYRFLDKYKHRAFSGKELPFMVDALNCSAGCLYGTGVEPLKSTDDDTLYELIHIRSRVKNKGKNGPWASAAPAERLAALNEQFKDLDINDFIRHYTDKSAACRIMEPGERERQDIFRSMKKDTRDKQNINCSACGYDTCAQMTTAIFNGCNLINNCVHYAKDVIRDEKIEVEREVAASTSRTHYMERLFNGVSRDVNMWLGEVGEALDSGNRAEQERILSSFQSRGHEALDFIQDTLVSIRRISQGLNLKEDVYSPENLARESIRSLESIAGTSPVRLMIRDGVPRSVYGDRERMRRVLTALLYKLGLHADGGLQMTLSASCEEYASILKVAVEAISPSCGAASYENFADFLQNLPGQGAPDETDVGRYKEDPEAGRQEEAIRSDLSMVDVFLRQMSGRLRITGVSGVGWSCMLMIPQTEPAETNP